MAWTGFDEAWLAERQRKVVSHVVRTQIETVKARERPVVESACREGLTPIVGLCRAAGLAIPMTEYRFHVKRRWRFDYAWPERKLALEVEGGLWINGRHTRGSGALADLEKYSEAAIAGWRIIYCVPEQIVDVGMDRIKRALGDTNER